LADIEALTVESMETCDFSFTTVANMVWARGDPTYRVALEEWEREHVQVVVVQRQREKSHSHVVDSVFWYAALYISFQASLLLGAFVNHLDWFMKFPVAWTVVASILFSLLAWTKLGESQDLRRKMKRSAVAHLVSLVEWLSSF